MIDFPSNPTVGQQFSAAGVIWTWDGTKWTGNGLGAAFLPLSGGTLSGVLNASAGILTGGLSMQAAVAQPNAFWGDVGGNARWLLELGDGSAETGANAGSNFAILSYSDAGTLLGVDLTINRATGQVTIPNLVAPGLVSPQARGDNRIINGDMRIVQRPAANGTATGYTVDRWSFAATQPTKFTWSQDPASQPGTAGPGFPLCLSAQSFGVYAPLATDAFQFQQPIEADLVSDFVWGTPNARPVTLSFWALVNNVSGTFSGALFNWPAPATRSYPFTFSVPVAGVWTKCSVTIPGDTGGTWVMSGGAAAALGVAFDLGGGANFRGPAGAWASGNLRGANGALQLVTTNGGYLALTGVKLETGTVATDFPRETMSKRLADCQRYYQFSQIFLAAQAGTAGQAIGISNPAVTAMRAIPTLTVTANSSSNWTLSSLTSNAQMILTAQGTAVAAGATTVNLIFNASAEL